MRRDAEAWGSQKAVCAPEVYWDENLVEGMTPEQRAVMFGPCSAPGRNDLYLTVDEDGRVMRFTEREA